MNMDQPISLSDVEEIDRLTAEVTDLLQQAAAAAAEADRYYKEKGL